MEKCSDELVRVFDEKWELRKKITRLFQFLNSGRYTLLNKKQRRFLKKQYHVMRKYYNILRKRIRCWHK
nr:MAG TPA: hypothetical protein [Caudoviricetes sp.]